MSSATVPPTIKTAERLIRCPYCGDTSVSINGVHFFSATGGKARFYAIDYYNGVTATEMKDGPKETTLCLEMFGMRCKHPFIIVFKNGQPAVGGTTFCEVSSPVVPLTPIAQQQADESLQLAPIWARLKSQLTISQPIIAQWLDVATPSWGRMGAIRMLIINFSEANRYIAKALALPEHFAYFAAAMAAHCAGAGAMITVDGKPLSE